MKRYVLPVFLILCGVLSLLGIGGGRYMLGVGTVHQPERWQLIGVGILLISLGSYMFISALRRG